MPLEMNDRSFRAKLVQARFFGSRLARGGIGPLKFTPPQFGQYGRDQAVQLGAISRCPAWPAAASWQT